MSATRRGFLFGLLATPAIIRTPGLLMPVSPKLIDASKLHGTYGAGAVTATISEVERKQREFWGLTPRDISRRQCDPREIIWTNNETVHTIRKGVSTLSPAEIETEAFWHRARWENQRAFLIENGFIFDGDRIIGRAA